MNRPRSIILFVLAATLGLTFMPTIAAADVVIPPANQILKTLRKEHPRLLITDSDIERLRKQIKSDDFTAKLYRGLRKEATELLEVKPNKWKLRDGVRLLFVSRENLERIGTLAIVYRLHGDKRCLERATQEMDAIAKFKDWNSAHFLDTAEMTLAMAIGYDWLYHDLSDAQRKRYREAMITHGLSIAKACYENKHPHKWWTRAKHNWNQVCNGGIGAGALAIADEEPELAGFLLHQGMTRLIDAMALYAPDGGYHEGPMYWSYGTRYNAIILAALDTALGKDFGLSDMKGFDEAGHFPIYMANPRDVAWNWADANEGTVREPAFFWLARRFKQPHYAAYQQRNARPTRFLNFIWHDPTLVSRKAKPLPLDRMFDRIDVATFRSAWDDVDALFVGLKGGNNQFNHSNLDLGSFALDALGQRWAIDLGKDDYNLPRYFDSGARGVRWTYYRMRAESHNTLVINPGKSADQNPLAEAPIIAFSSTPKRGHVVVNLSKAYEGRAAKVTRGLLTDRRTMLLQDEITALKTKPAEYYWFMHTRATITISKDGREATLTQGGKTLLARLIAPDAEADLKFEISDAKPLPTSPNPKGQKDNNDVRKLTLQGKIAKGKAVTITVQFVPVVKADQRVEPPTIEALAKWAKE